MRSVLISCLQKIKITEFDRENFNIKATGYGEQFSLDKHPQGTEVKAITYSNMQVHETGDVKHVYVIIDIWIPKTIMVIVWKLWNFLWEHT